MVTSRRTRASASPGPAPTAGPAAAWTIAPEESAPPVDLVEVARIVGAWGVKGAIRLKPLSADPQALFSSKRWWLEPPERAAARPAGLPVIPMPRLLRVIQSREQGDAVVATVHDVDDRDRAQALAGARVLVSRASFPTPDEGEFYWVDLVGLAVRNRQGRVLGKVDHLIETGPHCVLVVAASAEPAEAPASPVMIPFVDAYVDRVDRDAGVIEVDWDPEY